MDDDVLSQDEVESLLNVMESGEGSGSIFPHHSGQEFPPRQHRDEKITPYDFKRPERVGKEQMRALQTMHEGFGRNFGAALSALLRSIVDVKLTSVDQLTYGEFVFSLENPTCFNLINAKPLEGQIILDINPSILFPLIDRLLGGTSDTSSPARRPLTEIELRLAGRITGLFLSEMQHAWESVLKLELEVDHVESNPQLVQIVPPNEVVILISFELMLGDLRGMMNLCIPFNAIEQVANQLTSNSWVSYGKKEPTAESIQTISDQLGGSLLQMVVELTETKINTRDLIGLRVGDIITTEHDVRHPLLVTIEGRPKFHAEPGAYKGHKAIQVTESVTEHHVKVASDSGS